MIKNVQFDGNFDIMKKIRKICGEMGKERITTLKIQEEYKNRPIGELFDMYYGLPERMLITDNKGKVIFISEITEKEISEQIAGQPLAKLIGTEAAVTLLNAFAKTAPMTASGMWAKKRCVFSMTPYDGYMVIFMNLSEPQNMMPVIDANSVKFFEHETRSAISVINAALENVKKHMDINDENVCRNIAVIRQGVMRISHLTGDFVDCAKLDMNKLQVDANICDLTKCVLDICGRAGEILSKMGVKFETDIHEKKIISVADKNKIRRMIFNIIAVFCEDNRADKITLSMKTDGWNAVITIVCAIKDEKKINPLEINKELEAAEYAEFSMPAASAAAAAHGGRLICSKEPNRTTVRITLPVNSDVEKMKFNSPFDIKTDESSALEEFSRVLGWEFYK